jgi:ABC-type oligopeptide transport system ATPase subunit
MILNKSEPVISAVVVLQDLVVTFKKRKEKSVFQRQYTAVDHLSFYVPQGSCFGLLGT